MVLQMIPLYYLNIKICFLLLGHCIDDVPVRNQFPSQMHKRTLLLLFLNYKLFTDLQV